MATARELVVRLTQGRRVDVTVGTHTVRTDQPRDMGGEDSAPAPYDVFLASIGACAGVFVQGFCAKRNIPYQDIRLVERTEVDEDGTLRAVSLEVELPPSFPERYREALVRVVEQCSVKKAIAAQPEFRVKVTADGAGQTAATPH